MRRARAVSASEDPRQHAGNSPYGYRRDGYEPPACSQQAGSARPCRGGLPGASLARRRGCCRAGAADRPACRRCNRRPPGRKACVPGEAARDERAAGRRGPEDMAGERAHRHDRLQLPLQRAVPARARGHPQRKARGSGRGSFCIRHRRAAPAVMEDTPCDGGRSTARSRVPSRRSDEVSFRHRRGPVEL